jgi:hypothetical protein
MFFFLIKCLFLEGVLLMYIEFWCKSHIKLMFFCN